MNKRAVIIAVVIAALAVGVFFVRGFVKKDGNVDYLGDAFSAFAQARSVKMNLTLSAVAGQTSVGEVQDKLGIGSSATSVPIVVRGAIDADIGQDKPFSSMASWKVTGEQESVRIAQGETRIDATGRLYMRLLDLPAPSPGVTVDIRKLDDVWFTVDRGTLAGMFHWLDATDVGSNAPYDMLPVRKAMTEEPPFFPGARLDDDVISGRSVAHYRLQANPSGMTRLLQAVGAAIVGRDLTSAERSAAAEFVGSHDIAADAFVDKRDHRLARIKMLIVPSSGDVAGGPVGITMDLISFDNDVAVTPPQGASPLDVVVKEKLAPGAAAQ